VFALWAGFVMVARSLRCGLNTCLSPGQDPAMGQRVFRTLLEHLDSGRRWADSATVQRVLDPVRRPAEAQGQGFMLFAELARHLRSPALDAPARKASALTNERRSASCMP